MIPLVRPLLVVASALLVQSDPKIPWPPERPAIECEVDDDWWKPNNCRGMNPPNALDDRARASMLREFANKDANFIAAPTWTQRKANCGANECPPVKQKVEVVRDGRWMYLPGNRTGDLVILGRVTLADENQRPDKTFGLSTDGGRLHRVFLLVGRLPRKDEKDKYPVPTTPKDFAVSEFATVGFLREGNGGLVVKKHARVTHCAHDHSGYPEAGAADFLSCPVAMKLAMAAREAGKDPLALLRDYAASPNNVRNADGRALTDTQKDALEAALRAQEEGPIWFTCGVGCCTGEAN